MLSYLSIGANDVELSGRFYAALLLPLGYEQMRTERHFGFFLPDVADRDNGPGTIWVGPPFDGEPATSGNGMMPAFQANTRALVRVAYAAGMAEGGRDEGSPGLRPHYGENFYAAYLRDPVGNKLAVFCTASSE